MGILKKPYEITVWEDVWDSEKGKFIEQRIGIIGADSMQYQGRAIEPNLTRNANGTKKFTFKMYKHFIDNVTGKKVDNLFSDWLISERKVKLYYDSKWYDFIVKNIDETTDKYLYSYQLEDALVQELSKNGFGVVLDDSNNNNSGNVQYLAEKVLEDTDWEVEAETFVQTIEESLVYLQTKKPLPCYQIIDQKENDLKSGCSFSSLGYIPQGKTILGFYSSCTNKPYRFQFIYLEDLAGLEKDDHRIITNKDCQYYFDIVDIEANGDPEQVYITPEDEGERNCLEQYGFYLPSSYLKVTVATEDEIGNIVVSGKYRGKRIGFSQQSKFIPKLNRYVNIYDKNGTEYYGYQHTEYNSPTLIQNVISGYDFSSTSGWTGSRIVKEPNSQKTAQVENVYGYFSGNFQNAIDELEKLKNNSVTFTPYLKIAFTEKIDDNSKSVIINSCMYDNRISIGKIDTNEEWVLRCKYLNNNGILLTEGLSFSLGEYQYNTATGGYILSEDNIKFKLVKTVIRGDFVDCHFTVEFTNYNEKSFKRNSQIRLCIQENNTIGATDKTYYIEKIELFKGIYREDDSLILPESQGENIEEGVINSTYYYFLPGALDEIVDTEELKPEYTTKKLVYNEYKPVFNTGAEKIRSISAKESNYFNILQSIAETFEAWLDLEIKRDDFGGITEKIVHFKNYLGNNNYAGFRYGVNLKSIKRTHESKKIVTKLIVKDNKNEFAKNGFCTISRANANPTGENYIYDFQYFHNTGMLDARRYIDSVYSIDGACGKDIDINHEEDSTNINGYFLRVKALNGQIDSKSTILLNLSKDLLKLNADLEIAKAGKETAESQIEDCEIDFRRLTKLESIEQVSDDLKERDDVKAVLQKYVVANQNLLKYTQQLQILENNNFQDKYDSLSEEIKTFTEYKKKLNQLFYTKYSRFIQEGTWISEEYNDDEKYYADALSTMYNSCYPQVAYTFDVLELSSLPGYESFVFELGDKTFAEDPEFFGGDLREEVVITEMAEDLDDPSKNKIKVQNFKNQFQDLFQKITATTQQAQYNTGSYEKAVALAEATQQRKQQFFAEALDSANSRLANAGQQTVTWGADGITITKTEDASERLRLVAGAILFSKKDENGQHRWVTGVTSEGISANLITAGSINTRNISIMDSTNELFRWDKYGISAFAYNDFEYITSGLKKDRFVRFDQYGLYGIDGQDGTSWHATKLSDIDQQAKFALTWEGLKVTGNGGGKVHIGKWSNEDKTSNLILRILNEKEEETFTIDERGHVALKGNITWGENVLPDFSLNKEDLTNILDDASDGIYYDSTRGKICINASYLISGALSIRNGSGEIFCAELDQYTPTVRMAGWTVRPNQFVFDPYKDGGSFEDDEAQAAGSGKYTVGISTEGGLNTNPNHAAFFVSKSSNNLTNGPFYVTYGGALYAKKGNIAGWDITDHSMKRNWGTSKQMGLFPNGTGATVTINGHWGSDWTIVSGTNFGVTSSGKLYATDANIKGKITASSGNIGGWEISASALHTIGNALYLGTSTITATIGEINGLNLVFKAGSNFGVTNTGAMYASSGRIGGWEIGTDKMYSEERVNSSECGGMCKYGAGPAFWAGAAQNSAIWESAKFAVLHDGTFKANHGYIAEWTLSQAGLTKGKMGDNGSIYLLSSPVNTGLIDAGGNKISQDWLMSVGSGFAINTAGDVYAHMLNLRHGNLRLSLLPDVTNFLIGQEGGYTVNITSTGIEWHHSKGYSILGIDNSELRLDATEILLGFQSTQTMVEVYGSIYPYTDYSGSEKPSRNWRSISSKASGCIGYTDKPFQAVYTRELYYSDYWTKSDLSDIREKYSIEYLSEEYDSFFDKMQPKRFKYNHGTSDRYHTGFIAQQLVQSLEECGLTTQEFAALRLEQQNDQEERWHLRCQEIVSLNTWQIQKLKPRMTAAEGKIKQLEEEISQLKTEISTLKQ